MKKGIAVTFCALAGLVLAGVAWAQVVGANAVPAQAEPTGSALQDALSVSGKALIIIFIVMGIFGLLINLLGRVLPGEEEG